MVTKLTDTKEAAGGVVRTSLGRALRVAAPCSLDRKAAPWSKAGAGYESAEGHAREVSGRPAGRKPGGTSECSYGAERLRPERWRCVGAHLPQPGDAHGSRSPLECGGGAGRLVPTLEGAHFCRLVCHLPLSSGGAQPGGQLATATPQTDQAPPRHSAHLPGAGSRVALYSGNPIARAYRPDPGFDQVCCSRGAGS